MEPGVPPGLQTALEHEGISPNSISLVKGLESNKVWLVDVPCLDAIKLWDRLRKRVDDTGHWPVVVGGPVGYQMTLSRLADLFREATNLSDLDRAKCHLWPKTAADAIRMAQEVPFKAWLVQRRDKVFLTHLFSSKAEYYETIPGAEGLVEIWRKAVEHVRSWPGYVPNHQEYDWPVDEPASLDDFDFLRMFPSENKSDSQKWPLPESTGIVLAPTSRSWEMPAFLFFGHGELEDPEPQVHVAALEWLHEEYGAELMGITSRDLVVRTARRPQVRDETVRLLADLLDYATEICGLDRRVGIGVIAARLMNSTVWSFYFDT